MLLPALSSVEVMVPRILPWYPVQRGSDPATHSAPEEVKQQDLQDLFPTTRKQMAPSSSNDDEHSRARPYSKVLTYAPSFTPYNSSQDADF